jgi:hypothetical protein
VDHGQTPWSLKPVRLWSLHPAELDVKGLVACWREGLLARAVLHGQTRGYKNHPQLDRFKAQPDPQAALDTFLAALCDEADVRGYHFAREKLDKHRVALASMTVTDQQIALEWNHLAAKLAVRDTPRYQAMNNRQPRPHPLFQIISGSIEPWEKAASAASGKN